MLVMTQFDGALIERAQRGQLAGGDVPMTNDHPFDSSPANGVACSSNQRSQSGELQGYSSENASACPARISSQPCRAAAASESVAAARRTAAR
jgi:hypothetical protein